MTAPERIYGWRGSQLSIASHYGGLRYMGHYYYIDESDPEQPLVRDDVLKQATKDRLSQLKEAKRCAGVQQIGLYDEK